MWLGEPDVLHLLLEQIQGQSVDCFMLMWQRPCASSVILSPNGYYSLMLKCFIDNVSITVSVVAQSRDVGERTMIKVITLL